MTESEASAYSASKGGVRMLTKSMALELGEHGLDLRVVDLVEPEWPARNQQAWGGWSPLRGALLPGTAGLPASFAGLPARSACVNVGPPLSASASSNPPVNVK